MRETRIVLVLVAVGAAACDPGYSIHGEVRGPDGGPLQGARLTFDCPPGGAISGALPEQPFASDLDGGLDIDELGCGPRSDCTARVEAAGFSPWEARASDLCLERYGWMLCGRARCFSTRLDVHLQLAP